MTFLLWVLIAWFVSLSQGKYMTATPALGLTCTVSRSDGQTTYTIHNMPDVSGVQCYFSWTNKTGNVLANEAQSIPELVLRHSSRALTISGCSDMVHYEGTCEPKWEKLTANCTSSCVKKSGETKSRDQDKFINDITETSIIVAAVIIFVGLILAVLWCILKKKCIWKRSPIKGAYTGAELKTGQQGDHELPV